MNEERVVLRTTVGQPQPTQSLKLCLLGCEDQPPYGPAKHTGTMFLDLLKQAAERDHLHICIEITIYQVQQLDYPKSYGDFDGVLLPGSFSAAYQDDAWVLKLKEVIRESLWAQRIPTLGVCFGHQILAHAMEGGVATKCPSGPQVGCRFFQTRKESREFAYSDDDNEASQELSLLYTHGDMVETLPEMATALGGTAEVPIQGAIYHFEEDPIFVTFQAHPEYASQGPKQATMRTIMRKMEERGAISNHESALEQVEVHWETIYRDSMQVMVTTCRLLNWFPDTSNDQD